MLFLQAYCLERFTAPAQDGSTWQIYKYSRLSVIPVDWQCLGKECRYMKVIFAAGIHLLEKITLNNTSPSTKKSLDSFFLKTWFVFREEKSI